MSSIALSSSVAGTMSRSGESRAVDWRRFARVGLATVVAAVVANVLVYFGGDALVAYDPGFVELGNAGGIAIMTFIPATVAVLLYAALLRRSANPARVFTIVSAVVFVVTLIPDFTYIPAEPGVTNDQTAILVLMHVVAAGVIVWMLTTFARPRTR
jgi:magnesium-transporting ATPase (P-type)